VLIDMSLDMYIHDRPTCWSWINVYAVHVGVKQLRIVQQRAPLYWPTCCGWLLFSESCLCRLQSMINYTAMWMSWWFCILCRSLSAVIRNRLFWINPDKSELMKTKLYTKTLHWKLLVHLANVGKMLLGRLLSGIYRWPSRLAQLAPVGV